jgi:U3 small nucleolar RNA-associated protein 14
MEKAIKHRIQERITLRHRAKNKHIQNLLRFNKNNTQSIQENINQINSIRQQQLQKHQQEWAEDLSEELDQQNYQNNLEELQQEVDQMEEEAAPKQGLDSMKFMQIGKQKELAQQRQEIKALARMLDGEDVDMEAEEEEEEEEVEKEITRKTFGEKNPVTKAQAANNYIQRNLKAALASEADLTEGINTARLK